MPALDEVLFKRVSRECQACSAGWRNDSYKRTSWCSLAIPKLSSLCTETWVIAVSSWRAQGHRAGFPKTKAFSLKCMGHKGCMSGLCFLDYSINSDNVRNLPTTGLFFILSDKNNKSLVDLPTVFAPVAGTLFPGCWVFRRCSAAPPSVRWPALSRVLRM